MLFRMRGMREMRTAVLAQKDEYIKHCATRQHISSKNWLARAPAESTSEYLEFEQKKIQWRENENRNVFIIIFNLRCENLVGDTKTKQNDSIKNNVK